MRYVSALTIAGSDSGGGAGVQADLKTFAALGLHGLSVVTALTAQNTRGVSGVLLTPPAFVVAQMDAVLADFEIGAIKIGMLGSVEIATAVAARLAALPRERRSFVVYDPVMAASSGDALSGLGFTEALRAQLLPLVDCLTPNLGEAAALLGAALAPHEGEMARQGESLRALGAHAVLMKGGHLPGPAAVDILLTADRPPQRFTDGRIDSPNLHGTGCTLSSAIAALRALGLPLPAAVEAAKRFVSQSIERARPTRLGQGSGPLLQLPLRDLTEE